MSESQVLEICRDGLRLAVSVVGPEDGPCITFGHSLAADSSMWSPQVEAFGASHRLIMIDFRGHGRSSVPAGPYRIEDFAEDVCAVWDQLGIAASNYVGVSLGGAVGIALALSAPQRLSGLFASSCSLQATPDYVAIWEQRAELLAAGGMAVMADHMMPRWLSDKSVARAPEVAARLRQGIEQSSAEGWRATVAALCQMDFASRLGDIVLPFTLACGTADPVGAMMGGYAERAPDARFVEIDGGYHILNLDQPDQFNALIAEVAGARG